MKRVGIFGGTFDPIHTGHILIAEAARLQFGLDAVVFVPARRAPHKRKAVIAPAEHRVRMVRKAIRGHSSFTISDVEVRREGLSYTIHTLEHIQQRYPGSRLYLLLGSDNIRSFDSWKDPKRIAGMASLVVYRRWGYDLTPSMLSRWKARQLEGREIFISSTLIREKASSGLTIHYLVPPAVERYITNHNLYGSSRPRRTNAGLKK